jgi:CHAT domain-containing protein/tetratricopeptide (TPR) repeat protein
MIPAPVIPALLLLAAAPAAAAGEPAPSAAPSGAGAPIAAEPEERARIRQLMSDAKYAEAEAAARALLERMISRSGERSFDAAKAMDLVVTAMRRAGKARQPETMALLERSLAIKEEVFGPDHIEVARTLNGKVILLQVLGDYHGAMEQAARTVGIVERALGPDNPELGNFLNNHAIILQDLGRSEEALPIHRRVLALWERTYGAEHPDYAASLDNLASALSETGDYAGARPLYERSLAIKEKALGPDHPGLTTSLTNLANLLATLGDHTAADPLYARAAAIVDKALGPGHPAFATILNNRAASRREAGDIAGARALYERILALQQGAFGDSHPNVAQQFHDLGLLHSRSGDPAGAVPHLEQALAIRETSLGPDHPETAYTLTALANARRASGAARDVAHLYRRSLAILEAALGPDHPHVAVPLADLAALEFARSRDAEALDLASRAESIARRNFVATTRGLSEAEALRFGRARTSALGAALSIVAAPAGGTPPAAAAERALDLLIRSRALVLDEIGQRQRLGSDADPALTIARDEVRDARAALARLLVRGPDPEDPALHRRLVEEARRRVETAERALAAASHPFGEQRAVDAAGLEEVRGALDARTALVSLARYDALGRSGATVPSYLAFVTRRSGPVRAVPLGPAAAIDDLVRDWRERAGSAPPVLRAAAARAEADARTAGDRLRRAVWDPIAGDLGGAGRALLVPDGALNLVNVLALPVGRSAYLVERGPAVHLLSSERDLLRLGRPARSGGGLLLLGGADFDASPDSIAAAAGGGPPRLASAAPGGSVYRGPHASCSGFRAVRFQPLPASGLEIEEVAAMWGAAETGDAGEVARLAGAAAAETAFKEAAGRHAVLHLATHAFFVSGDCGDAADHPLLLAGLALAGANRRDAVPAGADDGVVTAEEIASLDLSGVRWAVLSACGTGVGRIEAGEGVFGLRRAFHLAGVRSLIMSLWEVEDSATRAWMRRLYAARLDGAGTAEAMRRAAVDTLRARRREGRDTHPFTWGAFVAAGDWR